jgi:lipopolysaccharide transport system permease protein
MPTLWDYRGFVLGSVKREFQAKYSQSILGSIWSIINPLMMVLIYTVIFTKIMSARLEGVDNEFGYSIFLCSGIFTWGLFLEIASRSQSIFFDNANLIKKLNFPIICLPLIILLSALLNFAIVMALFTVALLATDSFPGWNIFIIFPILLVQIVFSLGLGMFIGILNVFFRDIGQFFSLLLQLWFWLTPIIYPIEILPERAVELIMLNPMTPLIGAYQTLFVTGKIVSLEQLYYPFFMGLFFILLSMRLYKRHGNDIVDEL